MSRQFLEAAAKGDLAKVQNFLDQGGDIHWHKKELGRTALTEAAINGQLAVAKLLIDRGADLSWRDFAVGLTPLGWASECNHTQVAEHLLKAGADPNLASREYLVTPLMIACGKGNLRLAQLLVEKGADINAATCDGRTALSFAQTNRRTEIAEFLQAVGGRPRSTKHLPPPIPWPSGEIDYNRPESVLRSFVLAMNRFETEAQALDGRGLKGKNVHSEILARMQKVFDVHCTPIQRPYGRLGSYSIPPEYDLNAESLISISNPKPRRAELITRDRLDENEFLYVLVQKHGRWLIDSKKRRILGASWRNSSL